MDTSVFPLRELLNSSTYIKHLFQQLTRSTCQSFANRSNGINKMFQHDYMVDCLLLVRYRRILGNDNKLHLVSNAQSYMNLWTYL